MQDYGKTDLRQYGLCGIKSISRRNEITEIHDVSFPILFAVFEFSALGTPSGNYISEIA
jgi:hypothetical protein